MRSWGLLTLLLLAWVPLQGSYQVFFEGAPTQEILNTIEAVSQLQSEKGRPPPSLFTLKKRAEADQTTLIQALHSYGYYEATCNFLYLGAFPETTIRVQIDPGPLYCFGALTILDETGAPLLIPPSALNLQIGAPARSDMILDTEEQILLQIETCGYPFPTIAERKVVVDQARKEVAVTYIIDRGPLAYFGSLCIEGLKKVRSGYVARRLGWREGALYNPEAVRCTDTFLQESGLFSFVTVRPAEGVDADGNLPMLIQLEEKRYRHVGAGVSYSTDESAGAVAQWSHDNFSGWGDALSLVGEYSGVIQRGTFLYGLPDFYGRNQDLLYSMELRRENTPGFIEREASFLLKINRKVNRCFSFSYAGRFERLLSTKCDHVANYNLISAPIQLRWDTSNRLLNPTKGTMILYLFTPYKGLFNSHIAYLEQVLMATTYHSLTPKGRFLIAFSGQIGSIVGQSRFLIPAPKRFYAGSSVWLRGYKYLTVSPLDGTKPIGGRSLLIFQVEPRVQIWDKLYLALFYDIGNVYASSFPQLDEKLLRSTGVGVRYLTPVGPFRLDVAFPLDKRKGVDKSFQIYASIGQPF